jgi:hypothetical protein
MFPPEEPGPRPSAVIRTAFMKEVDSAVAETIIERVSTASAPFRAVQLRVLGGAAAAVSSDATAYAHRAAGIMVGAMAFHAPDDRPRQQAWVEAVAADLRQDDTGAYVNFLEDEGAERVRAAYPGATWERLRAIKAKYDPGNLFRLNQNIPPAE